MMIVKSNLDKATAKFASRLICALTPKWWNMLPISEQLNHWMSSNSR